MQINSISSAQGLSSVSGTQRTTKSASTSAAEASSLSAPVDQLDLSPEAQGLSSVQSTNQSSGDIRVDRVAELRRAIAEGNYDSPERISAALDSFLDRLA